MDTFDKFKPLQNDLSKQRAQIVYLDGQRKKLESVAETAREYKRAAPDRRRALDEIFRFRKIAGGGDNLRFRLLIDQPLERLRADRASSKRARHRKGLRPSGQHAWMSRSRRY